MAMIRSGKMLCNNCGQDCGKLFGMKMEVYDRPYDVMLQQKVAEVDKEMGTHNFVFCWMCTAKAFGAKPVAAAATNSNTGTYEVRTNNEVLQLENDIKAARK